MEVQILSNNPIWDITVGAYLRKAGHHVTRIPIPVTGQENTSTDVLIVDVDDGSSAEDAVVDARRRSLTAPIVLAIRSLGSLSSHRAKNLGIRALLRKPVSLVEVDLALDACWWAVAGRDDSVGGRPQRNGGRAVGI